MKKVLVTGAAGDVGSVLLPQLRKRFDATGFDLRPHPGGKQGDLTDYDAVYAALDGVEAVVHMAVLLPGRSGRDGDYVDANIKATTVLLQAAAARKVKRFVYCSTVWASGHGSTEPYQPIDEDIPCAPVCIYGQTKLLGESMAEWSARMSGMETVVIRFCGFHRVKGWDADGNIDWASADLPALFLRCLGAGFKLMDPLDLGAAFGQAVENVAAAGRRFIVGVYTPYAAGDAAALRSMPAAVVDRYYPGAARFLEDLGIAIPPVDYYFNHETARTLLGYRSRYDLGGLMAAYRRWKGSR